MPTMKFYMGGKEVHSERGGRDEAGLRALIDEAKKHQPKYMSFSGTGTSMGEEVKSTGGTVNTASTDGKPNIDPSKPSTQIQFRFHNGQRATLDVNLDHKV